MSTRVELTNGHKDIKEDYLYISNCIDQALLSGTNFIEVTEQYTVTQFIDEFLENHSTRYNTIKININHIISF